MSTQKCLYCYKNLDNSEKDCHSKCSKSFFGFPQPPLLEVNLADIKSLALNILGRSRSVTGVQPKLSVDLKKDKKEQARLTIVGLWGSYILKTPHKDFLQMPEIEDLTMHLAKITGIHTAEHSLVRLKSGELAYISKRFDRTTKGKMHVEDFAQLLEVLTERKYHGSVEQVGKAILRYSSFPGNDVINLFEIILFCYLTGNSDMHLKNFSLIRDESDDIKLSPAYDLLSTKLLLPEDKEELALPIKGKKANLKRADFDYLADNLGINRKTITSIYNKFVKNFTGWYSLIEMSFLNEDTKKRYGQLIKERALRIGL
jgi:serine/threonine-protein kinase HipA